MTLIKLTGMGYQDNRNQRFAEGIRKGDIEKPGFERYCIYWGRSHVKDHETGIEARGDLKAGRAKYTTALQRGRNEGGSDFRLYAEIILESNEATHDFEDALKWLFKKKNKIGDQGQRELYDVRDHEIEGMVLELADYMRANSYHKILEINLYHDGKPIDLLEEKDQMVA